MARKLEIDIDGNSTGGRKALDETARAVDHLGDETRRLQREFNEASREASKLDRKLLETTVAAKALAREFARTGDKTLALQLGEHQKAAAEIKRIQAAIVGDSEVKAKQSASAWRKAFRDLEKLGGVGSGFGGLLQGGGESGILGFLTSPAGMATAAGVAPFAGGAIGGATLATAGAGAGVAAGFAAYAADPSAVKRAIKAQTDTFIAEWKDAGRQALIPTLDSINMIGDAVRHIDLDRIIGKGAEHLQTLAAGTAEAIDFLGKGFAGFIDKADPAVKALSDGMAKLGRAGSIALDKIASGAEGGGEALADLFKILEAGIITVGTVVGWTEELYHGLKKAGEGAGDFLASWNPFAKAAKDFVDTRGNYVTVLTEIDRGAKAAAAGLADMSSQARLANEAFASLFGDLMNVDQANLSVKIGLADLTKAAKDHTTTQDELTQKVLAQIQALQNQRQAQLNTGDSSEAATARINANYNAQLEQLKKLFPALAELIDKYEELAKPLTKKIDIIIQEKRIGSVSIEGVVSGGDQRRNTGRGYASGVMSAPPGLAWVGEGGRPELVNFHGGERVYNPSESAAIMRGFASPPSTASLARMVGSGVSASASAMPRAFELKVAPGSDRGVAGLIMYLIRTGQLQISPSG